MDAWIGRSVSPSFAHHCPTRASVEVNDFLWHLINNSSSSSDIVVSWSFHLRLAKGSSVARCSTPIFTRHLSQVVARWNYTLRTKGTAATASFLVTVSRIFDLDCVLTVVHFRISGMVCSPPRYLIPESEQTQSIRSSGSSALRVRHTTRFKVLPSKIAQRRSLRVAQHRALLACQLLETRKRRWDVCKHARMIARAPHGGAATVDPTKWRRKGPVSLPELCLLAFGDNGGESILGSSAAIFTSTFEG